MGYQAGKVPAGTTERFFRPCGTLFSWVRALPSAEAPGYFHGIPPFNIRVVKQPDKQAGFRGDAMRASGTGAIAARGHHP